MKHAFVFPGQGAQFPGMGKTYYENNSFAKRIFEQANDILGFRISDVMLMKAEAILRGGTATANPASLGGGATALTQVNALRTHASRGASALASLTLDNLIDERGRELYWESWRRSDLVRFGKYLAAWQEKPADPTDGHTLIFPIPARSLAANPNLTQNAGY